MDEGENTTCVSFAMSRAQLREFIGELAELSKDGSAIGHVEIRCSESFYPTKSTKVVIFKKE